LRAAAVEFAGRGLSWTEVAGTLGVPRSRLYQRRRPREATVSSPDGESSDAAVVCIIREELAREPRYRCFGYRRWRAVLRQRGLVVNHKRLRRILGQAGLSQRRIRRSQRQREPWVRHRPAGPNQMWQMDMTRIYLDDGTMVHHMAIIDVYDRQIVGHHESLRCRAGEWLAAWDKALLNRFPDGPRGRGLVLQVDNGCHPQATVSAAISLCVAPG